jgi:uncharacterized repeat protein (TIGR03843 family)
MPEASNYTFLAEVVEGKRWVLAVYKPRSGETPLWDFPDGTLCQREVAAYLVSRGLGWDLVPPTLLRDGPHGPGAVQRYVDHDPDEHYFTLMPMHADDFRRVAAFDLIINNTDRKSGHCMRERSTGRIQAVDHGVTFHEQPKLRTVIWDFAGEPVPPPVLKDARDLIERLDGSLRDSLGELLDQSEIEALRRRVEALVRSPVYPEPGARRPYPWPPI